MFVVLELSEDDARQLYNSIEKHGVAVAVEHKHVKGTHNVHKVYPTLRGRYETMEQLAKAAAIQAETED